MRRSKWSANDSGSLGGTRNPVTPSSNISVRETKLINETALREFTKGENLRRIPPDAFFASKHLLSSRGLKYSIQLNGTP